MPTMKRIQYHRYGGPEVMRLEDFEPRELGAEDVLVRVRAAAANPMDFGIRNGAKMMTGRSFPRGMGYDFAGIVEAVGDDVTRLRVGDEVLGGASIKWSGAFADVVVAEQGSCGLASRCSCTGALGQLGARLSNSRPHTGRRWQAAAALARRTRHATSVSIPSSTSTSTPPRSHNDSTSSWTPPARCRSTSPEDVDAQRSHHQHQAQPSEHGEKRHTWLVPRRDRSTSDRRHRRGRASRRRRSTPVTDRPSVAIIGSNPSAHGTGTKRQREAGQAHHSARVSPPDRRRCFSPRCFPPATDGGTGAPQGVQLRCGRDSFATTRVPNATN
jgi:hypothetical protein